MSDGAHRARRSPKQVSRPAAVASLVAAVSAAGVATAGPAAAVPVRDPAATAIDRAMAAIGTPYAWGGASPKGYDCSGLTLTAYRAAGVNLPRVSRQQYRTVTHVPVGRAEPGDLIFWGKDPKRADSVYHVAVYLGAGWMVAAPRTGMVVQVQRLNKTRLMPFAVRPAGLKAKSVLPVRPGTRGAEVRVVQRRLRANGYDVPITGYYGSKTRAAVTNFQRRNGLRGTQVGAATWVLLLQQGAKDKNR